MTKHPYDESYLKATISKALEDPYVFKLPKGIIRYDYRHTHGWWVRVTREKASFRKFFSDGLFSSFEDGLIQAIRHRHELLAAFPINEKFIHPRTLPQEPEKRVHLRQDKGVNNPYVYYMAVWHDDKYKRRTKNFSVAKYGHEEAKALALAAARKHNPVPKLTAVHDSYQDERWRQIPRDDVEVLSSINSGPHSPGSSRKASGLDIEPHGFEGERKFVLHQSIERDRILRKKKIDQFLDTHGRLFCELCKFSFIDTFSWLNADIIEVHHTLPLGKLEKGRKVHLGELMLLCSNCHFAIHQGDAESNLLAALEQFE